jgi:hypothetical protein
MFFNNHVQAPSEILKPEVELAYPMDTVSPCKEVTIYIKTIKNNGGRPLSSINWFTDIANQKLISVLLEATNK